MHAIGSVIKGPNIPHRASEEGIKVVDALNGKRGVVNYEAMPFVINTFP